MLVAACRGCLVGHVKHRGKTSTATSTDEDAALLAQAEAIKDNPDAYLPVEELDVVMA